MNKLEQILKEILTKVNDLGTRLDRVEQTMATKDELAEIRQTMEDEFVDIRKTMATKEDVAEIPFIKQAVIEIQTEQACMNQTIEEMREDIQRIIKVQDEQQKIIEILSIRTTEHEAKLKFA